MTTPMPVPQRSTESLMLKKFKTRTKKRRKKANWTMHTLNKGSFSLPFYYHVYRHPATDVPTQMGFRWA